MSTPLDLGALLANTRQQEKDNTREAAERAARQTSQAALEAFNEVAAFFAEAKGFFTDAIRQRLPSRQVEVLVGDTRRASTQLATRTYHHLSLWANSVAPRVLERHHPMHCLWADFEQWALDAGLQPSWQYRHDGCGMESWWALRVDPAADAVSTPVLQTSTLKPYTAKLQQSLKDFVRAVDSTTGLTTREKAAVEAARALQAMLKP
jgi:hypothetical protein